MAALGGASGCTPIEKVGGSEGSQDTALGERGNPNAGEGGRGQAGAELREPGPRAGEGGAGVAGAVRVDKARAVAGRGGSRGEAGSAAGSGGEAGSAAGSGGMAPLAAPGGGRDSVAGSGETTGPMPEPPPSREPLALDQTAIVAELADAEALTRLSSWQLLPVFASGRFRQQSSQDRGIDLGTEAQLLPNIAYGNRDMNNFICKSADLDVNDNGFLSLRYDMPSCPEEYVHGAVLARFEGSGRMNRFWLVTGALAAENSLRDEIVRVYVDDNPRAVLQVPLEQVATGGAGEVLASPFGATSRNFVAWYYPVVFASKLLVVLDHLTTEHYYQVDAVLDAEPQPRAAPRARLGERDRAHALLAGGSPVPPGARTLRSEPVALASGAARTLNLTGPATIQELRLRVPRNKLASLTGSRVAVRWDARAEAAIDVPLLDLFAAAQAVPERSSLAIAASLDGETQVLSLRLPMPFASSADWTLSNTGSAAVEYQLEWIGEDGVPDAPFGRLSVQANTVQQPPERLEQTLAEAKGRGRFVGVCGDLGGHRDPTLAGVSNFDMMQGDFRGVADGQRVVESTGTEDYADNAFFFRDSPKATPFAQNWARVDSSAARPPAQISFCRWQILGSEIDFQQDFRLIRELAQRDPTIVDRHHTVAFLYLE